MAVLHMDDVPGFSLWLLPEASLARRLDGLVARLAPLFGCPAFQAHMTVQGDLAGGSGRLETILDEAGCMSMEFGLSGIGVSPAYFRSFYLDFHEAPGFHRLQTWVVGQTGTRAGLALFPHVSLAYGEPADPEMKERLRGDPEFAALPGNFRFDRLALVRSSKDVPIERWSVLQIRQLN